MPAKNPAEPPLSTWPSAIPVAPTPTSSIPSPLSVYVSSQALGTSSSNAVIRNPHRPSKKYFQATYHVFRSNDAGRTQWRIVKRLVRDAGTAEVAGKLLIAVLTVASKDAQHRLMPGMGAAAALVREVSTTFTATLRGWYERRGAPKPDRHDGHDVSKGEADSDNNDGGDRNGDDGRDCDGDGAEEIAAAWELLWRFAVAVAHDPAQGGVRVWGVDHALIEYLWDRAAWLARDLIGREKAQERAQRMAAAAGRALGEASTAQTQQIDHRRTAVITEHAPHHHHDVVVLRLTGRATDVSLLQQPPKRPIASRPAGTHAPLPEAKAQHWKVTLIFNDNYLRKYPLHGISSTTTFSEVLAGITDITNHKIECTRFIASVMKAMKCGYMQDQFRKGFGVVEQSEVSTDDMWMELAEQHGEVLEDYRTWQLAISVSED
ncbi:hypothetical protein DFH27DRAFT_637805 [Peziza echinospora]|nr:hypothetical protein DFH27DRAFT_637805 [Peziza echinospora]